VASIDTARWNPPFLPLFSSCRSPGYLGSHFRNFPQSIRGAASVRSGHITMDCQLSPFPFFPPFFPFPFLLGRTFCLLAWRLPETTGQTREDSRRKWSDEWDSRETPFFPPPFFPNLLGRPRPFRAPGPGVSHRGAHRLHRRAFSFFSPFRSPQYERFLRVFPGHFEFSLDSTPNRQGNWTASFPPPPFSSPLPPVAGATIWLIAVNYRCSCLTSSGAVEWPPPFSPSLFFPSPMQVDDPLPARERIVCGHALRHMVPLSFPFLFFPSPFLLLR